MRDPKYLWQKLNDSMLGITGVAFRWGSRPHGGTPNIKTQTQAIYVGNLHKVFQEFLMGQLFNYTCLLTWDIKGQQAMNEGYIFFFFLRQKARTANAKKWNNGKQEHAPSPRGGGARMKHIYVNYLSALRWYWICWQNQENRFHYFDIHTYNNCEIK